MELKLIGWHRRGRPPSVAVTINAVQWKCRVSGSTISSTIAIEYEPATRLPEFISLEQWVRELARSQPWIAEELADELATKLAERISACVTITIEFDENPLTRIRVNAKRCPRSDDVKG